MKPFTDQNLFDKTPKYLYETPLKRSMININHSSSFTELGFHIVNWNQDPMWLDYERDRALNKRNANNQQEVLELLELLEISLHENDNLVDGATINQQDNWGRTRLHHAVFYTKSEEFEKLLKTGADINIKDNFGLTALELARYLQERFTHKVSPEFFDGQEKLIKAGNCSIWKKYEEKLLEFQVDEINSTVSQFNLN